MKIVMTLLLYFFIHPYLFIYLSICLKIIAGLYGRIKDIREFYIPFGKYYLLLSLPTTKKSIVSSRSSSSSSSSSSKNNLLNNYGRTRTSNVENTDNHDDKYYSVLIKDNFDIFSNNIIINNNNDKINNNNNNDISDKVELSSMLQFFPITVSSFIHCILYHHSMVNTHTIINALHTSYYNHNNNTRRQESK